MKFVLFIFFVFFTNYVVASEENNAAVEVINLYETKSLDQMVLDSLNNEEEIQEIVDGQEQIDEVDNDKVEVKQIEVYLTDKGDHSLVLHVLLSALDKLMKLLIGLLTLVI